MHYEGFKVEDVSCNYIRKVHTGKILLFMAQKTTFSSNLTIDNLENCLKLSILVMLLR